MFKDIKAVIFDLDGTIYYGNKIIDGVNDVIDYFKCLEKRIFFLTNNSTKTRKQIFEKMLNMGIHCKYEEVFTSGYVAALYAKKEQLNNIYIFGSKDLIMEFENLGISIVDEDKAENLVIGYDTDLDYKKLAKAFSVAIKAKKIISCNKEKYFPGENSKLMPGCGAMVAAIEFCANRTSDFIIGKPNTLMLDILSELNNLSNIDMIMIGDTYESDIEMAKIKGCKSIYIGKNIYSDTICVNNIKDIIKL